MAKISIYWFLLVIGLFVAMPSLYAQGQIILSSQEDIIPGQNATAGDFSAYLVPIKDKIALEDVAEFDLIIINNLKVKDEFRIYTLSTPVWEIHTKPLSNPIILDVPPMSSKTIRIYIDPLHVKSTGNYLVDIRARSLGSDKFVKLSASLSIKSATSLVQGYVPTVIVDMRIPENIDPRDEIPILINLDNQNLLNYSELIIRIESNLINRELKEKLKPEEQKTIKIIEKLDDFTEPQKDKVSITVFMEDKAITEPLSSMIEIVQYEGKQEASSKGFLKHTKDITVSSNDATYTGPVNIETTLFKSLFTSTSPRSKIVNDGEKIYYSFDVELTGNTMQITVSENYSPLFLVVLLGLAVIVVYFMYRCPLVIRKTAQAIERKEGGIHKLKVILNVKNRSRTPIKSINLMDRLPNIVEMEKEVSLGMLHPVKIVAQGTRGTLVKWIIDELNIGEERVVSYRIQSKLPIIGDFTLRPAFARFTQGKNQKKGRSNSLNVI